MTFANVERLKKIDVSVFGTEKKKEEVIQKAYDNQMKIAKQKAGL